MRSRFFLKLLSAFFLVILAATITMDVTIRRAWEESLRQQTQLHLLREVRLFANRVENDRGHTLAEIVAQEARAADARATMIDSSGKVLADSEADPAQMENHAQRPEVAAALRGGAGSSSRTSKTLGIEFMYVAAPVRGGVVRLAYPLADVRRTAAVVRRNLLIASVLALLAAALLAAWIAHSLSRRLRRMVQFAERVAAGDLAARISETSSDELATVAAALDAGARQLEESFQTVEQSRQQLEILLNSMQEAVIAVSADGRVEWANGHMDDLVPRGTRRGMPMIESIRDPEMLRCLRETLSGGAVHQARAVLVAPGKVFQVVSAPLPSGGAVAVLQDLTEIERVEKTRRDFIANVSHELRTPLTSIQGYAETLLDGSSDPGTVREFAEIIRKNAVRVSRLTDDLLVLARVESGEQRFQRLPVAPRELIADAFAAFHKIAENKGMELLIDEVAPPPDPGNLVLADYEAIHQVFANLIENAIKYSPSGAKITLGYTIAGPDFAEFYVRDSGPGIPSEHLPRIFERFYRVDKARSAAREGGGTGLGLAIAKHIVISHGGAIRVDSKMNHGSCFFFTLPLSRASSAASPASPVSPPSMS